MDEEIAFLNGMRTYQLFEAVDSYEDGYRSVYAFWVPVGEPWKVSSLSPSTLDGTRHRYFNLPKAVPLMIDKAGIYYYGRILVRGGQGPRL